MRFGDGRRRPTTSSLRQLGLAALSSTASNRLRLSATKPNLDMRRYFFDMLCAMDPDVMGQYVVPHLHPQQIQNIAIVCYADQDELDSSSGAAGVYSRHVMRDLFLLWTSSYNCSAIRLDSSRNDVLLTFPFNPSSMCSALHKRLWKDAIKCERLTKKKEICNDIHRAAQREEEEDVSAEFYERLGAHQSSRDSIISSPTEENNKQQLLKSAVLLDLKRKMSQIMVDFVGVGCMSLHVVITQCVGCKGVETVCRFAGRGRKGLLVKKASDCNIVMDVVMSVIKHKQLPIHTLEIGYIDLDSPSGVKVMAQTKDMLRGHLITYNTGVDRIVLDGVTCRTDAACFVLNDTIKLATRGCKVIKLGILFQELAPRHINCFCSGISCIRPDTFNCLTTMMSEGNLEKFLHAAHSYRHTHCSTVEVLELCATVLPIHKHYMDVVVMDVYAMPCLKELRMETTCVQYDSTTNFMNRCNRYLKKNQHARLYQLREVHLVFTSGASGSIRTEFGNHQGFQFHNGTAFAQSEDDEDNGEVPEGEVTTTTTTNVDQDIIATVWQGFFQTVAFERGRRLRGPEADMFSEDRCPALRKVVITCVGGPIATLKVVDFLKSFVKCRSSGPSPESQLLDSLHVSADYLPERLVKETGELHVALKKSVTKNLITSFRKTYTPGTFIHHSGVEGTAPYF